MNLIKMRVSVMAAIMVLALGGVAWSQTGVHTLNGGTQTQTGQTYGAAQADQSAVYVLNAGQLTLSNCTMTKSGNSSNLGTSGEHGINAGVLANSAGQVVIAGGSVTTGASGASGLFATGVGSVITMTGGAISTSGTGSPGVDVTYEGGLILGNVDVTTTADNSPAIATGIGAGCISVGGGTILAANAAPGSHSAGLYATGTIAVVNAAVTSNGDCGGVIEGGGAISLTGASLTGALDGIRVHFTAPAAANAGIMLDSSTLTAHGGSGFLVTGASGNPGRADIVLSNGSTVSGSDGNILLVLQSSEASFMAVGVTLTGNLRADATSTLTILMGTGATLTGMIERGSLEMVGDCTWTVTENSVLTELIDDAGIAGAHVTNIIGNGHNVHYDANLPANDYLGGYSYILVNGGLLTPGTVSRTESRTWGSVKAEYR